MLSGMPLTVSVTVGGTTVGGGGGASQSAPIPVAARIATKINHSRLFGGLTAPPGLGFILFPSESSDSHEAQPEQQCGSRLGYRNDRDHGVGGEVVEGVARAADLRAVAADARLHD